MDGFDERLTKILAGYVKLLREKELALSNHQLYMVRRVKPFLLFAKEHRGYTFRLPDPWQWVEVEGGKRGCARRGHLASTGHRSPASTEAIHRAF